jgi:hypothetical protein
MCLPCEHIEVMDKQYLEETLIKKYITITILSGIVLEVRS